MIEDFHLEDTLADPDLMPEPPPEWVESESIEIPDGVVFDQVFTPFWTADGKRNPDLKWTLTISNGRKKWAVVVTVEEWEHREV